MKHHSDKRRRLITASLAIPLLGNIPAIPVAQASQGRFFVPEEIQNDLYGIYGNEAKTIFSTDKLFLKAPDIAENGAVVPMSVTGKKGLVSSMAIFVEKNPKSLTSTCTFHETTDLSFSIRIKLSKTSDIYVIAKTQDGLLGIKKKVKVTIGCGGG